MSSGLIVNRSISSSVSPPLAVEASPYDFFPFGYLSKLERRYLLLIVVADEIGSSLFIETQLVGNLTLFNKNIHDQACK